jgi:hypothetical protein
MSKDSITISEKHGLNPTLGICFWCGEHTGDIALLGKLPDDAEAPKEMVLNYDPCDKCAKHFESGVLIFEVNTDPNKPPIKDTYRPTGRYVVVKAEAFANQQFKNGDKCMLEANEFEQMFGSIINN